jgi:hypothetical protein
MGTIENNMKKCIGAGATMEGEFWSIFGVED